MISKPMLLLLNQRKKKKWAKSKAKVAPKWLFPHSQERKYDKILHALTKEIKRLINEMLIPAIPFMIQEVESKMPSNDRADDYLTHLNAIILQISNSLKLPIDKTIKEAIEVGISIEKFNRQQFQKTNNFIYGIDLFENEPWLRDQLELFANQNAQLIKSMTDQELERVSQATQRNLQEGKSYQELSSYIKKSFNISDRRANLIARDQTTKLNSSLTKLRQQEIGVTEYIWQTSGDERVRPTHRAHDGKKFKWDKPPRDTGHPGNDVNCRCVAIAVLDDLLDLD